MRRILLAALLTCCLASALGCVRHTYYVELANGQYFYADPPLVLDTDSGLYTMWVGGTRRTIPINEVTLLDDAAQICFQNTATDSFTCFDALYQF
jgi:hypothetical protein